MQLWTNFLDWLASDDGWRITSGAIIPFVAIIVAGIVAAAIGRGSSKRIVALSDRDIRFSAVATLVSAARKSAVWNSLPVPEQHHLEHQIGEADTRIRLLSTPGSALAADWAAHELASFKKNAVSFGFQAEQSLAIFRDRLIEWQSRPSRAKRLFKNDLEVWAYDDSQSDHELAQKQQAWSAQQSIDTNAFDTHTPDTNTPHTQGFSASSNSTSDDDIYSTAGATTGSASASTTRDDDKA